MVVPGSVTLLNLIDTLPEKQSPIDIERENIVGKVVYKLLNNLEDKKMRENFIEQIFDKIETYSSKIYFIDTVFTALIDEGPLPVETTFKGKILRKFSIEVGETRPPMPSRE
mgnify:FL=1|jgi:hypothetical protein